MTIETDLRAVLGKVFDGLREGLGKQLPAEEYERLKADFVFHMTDWRQDLEQLADLVSRPGEWTEETATVVVVGFLCHVVPHLMSARELLLDEEAESLPSLRGSLEGTRG